jgi:peptidoglycan/LPS O-acetylase OafA/YrhL
VSQAPSISPAPAARPGRILFLDGTRGIAALAVAVLHLVHPVFEEASKTAAAVTRHGFQGVTVFFVVSGFAISQSLAGAWITPPTAGRFLLRRVCRLDPPYWASIALVFVVAALARVVLHQPPASGHVGLASLVAHVLYLQYFLDIPSIADVYWTLAYEIQFYLLLVTLLAIRQRLERVVGDTLAFALTFAPPLLYWVLFAYGLAPTVRGACTDSWYIFFAGVAAQRLVARNDWRTFAVVLVVVAIVGRGWATPNTTVGFALLIALGHFRGKLGVWLSGRPWQFLGRISYSFYLTHLTVGGRFANLLGRFIHPSPLGRVLVGLVGLAVAIAFSQLFWWAIERPSLALSRSISVRARLRPPVPATETP